MNQTNIQALEALLEEIGQDRSDYPENIGFSERSEAIREAIEVLKAKESGQLVRLPKISQELWNDYNETCLMTMKDGAPHWTQLAVDFACVLKEKPNE